MPNSAGTTLLRRYVHGPGTDEAIVWYEGSGTSDRRFLVADERGSIVAVTNSSGAALNKNVYDEYGAPASANAGRFQYTGQVWLPETGLYHYKARAYSPTLGRFIQPDPIGYEGGLNLYAYVGNDPINNTDPSGLECNTDGNSPSFPSCDYFTGSFFRGGNAALGVISSSWVGGADSGSGGRGGSGGGGTTCWDECVIQGVLPPFVGAPPFVTAGLPAGAQVQQGPSSGLACADCAGVPAAVTEVIITGWKKRKIGNKRINFSLDFPVEQMWVMNSAGGLVFVPTKGELGRCKNGSTYGKNVPVDRSFSLAGALLVLHGHPDWALPFPGPGDGVIPRNYDIPNIGFSQYGVWAVVPGDRLTATCFRAHGDQVQMASVSTSISMKTR